MKRKILSIGFVLITICFFEIGALANLDEFQKTETLFKLPKPLFRIHENGTIYLDQDLITDENGIFIIKEKYRGLKDKRAFILFENEEVLNNMDFGRFINTCDQIREAGIRDISIFKESWRREDYLSFIITETADTVNAMPQPLGYIAAPIVIPENLFGPLVITLGYDMTLNVNRIILGFNSMQQTLKCILARLGEKIILLRADARISMAKILELSIIIKAAGGKTIGIICDYFSDNSIMLDNESSNEIDKNVLLKEVWIMPKLVGQLREERYIKKIEIIPPTLIIKGPVKLIRDICYVETVPIDHSAVNTSGEFDVKLVLPYPEVTIFNNQIKAKVTILVSRVGSSESNLPIRVMGAIRPPKLLKSVEPIYPKIARESKVEGVVIIEVTTDEYGRVQSWIILRSILLLDQAAIEAVKQYIYDPLIIDDKPRGVIFTVTVRFKL